MKRYFHQKIKMDETYREQLLEKINEIKHEIRFKQNRLEYNI